MIPDLASPFRPRALSDDVSLRLLELADAPALAAAFARNREYLAPWDPARSESFFTPAAQENEIATLLKAHGDGIGLPLLLVTSDAVVGRVNLSGLVRGSYCSANLGYWIDAGLAGRGLMSGAVDAVLTFARDGLGLHRIQAATLLHNTASQAVLRHAGFERIGMAPKYLRIAGEWQDHLLFQRILGD